MKSYLALLYVQLMRTMDYTYRAYAIQNHNRELSKGDKREGHEMSSNVNDHVS